MPNSKSRSSGGAIAAGTPRLADPLNTPKRSQADPQETTTSDKFRLEAERFLHSLPPGTRGILLTERGFRAITGETNMGDLITLMELTKHELLNQIFTRMGLLSTVQASLSKEQAEPYNLEKDPS